MERHVGVVRQLIRDEEGATLLEYGILVMLIAVVSVVAVRLMGSKVSGTFTAANTALP
jgi:pilus assembly protein Flp/PilA